MSEISEQVNDANIGALACICAMAYNEGKVDDLSECIAYNVALYLEAMERGMHQDDIIQSFADFAGKQLNSS